MSIKPSLILQLHRMGDLILTFPLAKKMKELDPLRPLWIVAEPTFYTSLLAIAPEVVFIPPDAEILKTTAFHKIINLSQRKEAAILAAQLEGEEYIGAVEKDNVRKIHGFWELYRSSLVNNSRHNLFHWSDLNCLEILSPSQIGEIPFAYPHKEKITGRIGLFVGASSPIKRPDPHFYGILAKKLLAYGLKPVFLGGKEDILLGTQSAYIANAHAMNLCGHFTLSQFVLFLNELDLLITPDTGPMHVAAAFGVPTLCLAMGNVNPYETSQASPHHFVLQGNMSCTSCWQCHRNLECKKLFTPHKVAQIVLSLIKKEQPCMINSKLNLLQTARNDLHYLINLQENSMNLKKTLSLFWKGAFLSMHQKIKYNSLQYLENYPEVKSLLLQEILLYTKEITQHFKKHTQFSHNSWLKHKPIIQPYTSFIQLYLENQNYSPFAFENIFQFQEYII